MASSLSPAVSFCRQAFDHRTDRRVPTVTESAAADAALVLQLSTGERPRCRLISWRCFRGVAFWWRIGLPKRQSRHGRRCAWSPTRHAPRSPSSSAEARPRGVDFGAECRLLLSTSVRRASAPVRGLRLTPIRPEEFLLGKALAVLLRSVAISCRLGPFG